MTKEEKQLQSKSLRYMSIERTINQAISQAVKIEEPDQSLQLLLSYVGRALLADRVNIFELREKKILGNTYEWCRDGVNSQLERLRNIPLEMYRDSWLPRFQLHQTIVLHSQAEYKNKYPMLANILCQSAVEHLIVIPLFFENRFIGYFAIENSRLEEIEDITILLETVAAFTASLLRHRDNVREIRRFSERDLVTDTYNLFSFQKAVERRRQELSRGGNHSVIFSITCFNLADFHLYNDVQGIEKGNECLKKITEVLSSVFQTKYISRTSADHFLVFYHYGDVISRVQKAHAIIWNLYPEEHFWLEAGVYYLDNLVKTSTACDLARTACSMVDRNQEYYFIYTQQLKNERQRQQYVQEMIDTALDRGYIRVQFSPVFRLMTGKLCCLRAVAIWDDPRYGIIPPEVYLPLLEKKRLSYKISRYLLKTVARTQAECQRQGRETVPIMLHVSPADFTAEQNPLALIDNIVHKYNIQRSLIGLEVTEEMVIRHFQIVQKMVKSWQKAGYEVFLDGLGKFTSFEQLSDLAFHEVRLNLANMQRASERQHALLRAIVPMLKKMGMHIAACGVRTQWQLDFLRSLGCEKVEGSYFHTPADLPVLNAYLQKKGISLEPLPERYFYQQSGLTNIISDASLALVLKQGEELKSLFVNRPFQQLLHNLGYETYQDLVKDPKSFLGYKSRQMAQKSQRTHQVETTIYQMGDRLTAFSLQVISSHAENTLFLLRSQDISGTQLSSEANINSAVSRTILRIYEYIYQMDFNTQMGKVLQSPLGQEKLGDVHPLAQTPLENALHPEDREHYRQLLNQEYVQKRLQHTACGSFLDILRVKQNDGSYQIMQVTILASVDARKKGIYLFCLSPSCLADTENRQIIRKWVLEYLTIVPEKKENGIPDVSIWQSLLATSNLKIFWKDRQGRYLGASQAFLDYYGVSSLASILHKNAQEVGWGLVDEGIATDEAIVLREGRPMSRRKRRILRHGHVEEVLDNFLPIYHGDKIVGLLGYFYDANEWHFGIEDIMLQRLTDISTGFLTPVGFYNNILMQEDVFHFQRQDYRLALLEVDCVTFRRAYGDQAAEHLLVTVANIVRHFFGDKAILTRLGYNHFCVLSNAFQQACDFERRLARCNESVCQLRQVDNHPCTLSLKYSAVHRSEVLEVARLLPLLVNRLEVQKKMRWNFKLAELKLRMQEFSTLFEQVRLVDPVSGEEVSFLQDGRKVKVGPCWLTLGQQGHCVDCIAARASKTGNSAFKLEYINGQLFFIAAHAVRVQGEKLVLTLLANITKKGYAFSSQGDDYIATLVRNSQNIYLDSLSGVYNRRFYDEQMADRMIEGLAFIDIDKFKQVNDTYGHNIGDKVLQFVGKVLKNGVRNTDLVARYGGDEFVVVFDSITEDALQRRLEKMCSDIFRKELVGEEGEKFHFHISIGGCYGLGLTSDMLLEADKMLYQAKAAGGNNLRITRHQLHLNS